ncbi:MAG TPA: hypothetical protein ACFYDZ_02960 [Candidatus Brocadiaceae bacterium]
MALLRNFDVSETVARACTSLHAQILKMAEVTRVLFPEEDMMANSILFPGVLEYIELRAEL